MPTLDAVLQLVSRNCLGGRAVPPALAALWERQLQRPHGATHFEPGFLVRLVAEWIGESADGLRRGDPDFGVTPAQAQVLAEVLWFATDWDKFLLMGYWPEPGEPDLARAAVVLVDHEGQLELAAGSLEAAVFAELAGEPDGERYIAPLRAFLAERGLALPASLDEVDAGRDAHRSRFAALAQRWIA